jgi:hypothetical protein
LALIDAGGPALGPAPAGFPILGLKKEAAFPVAFLTTLDFYNYSKTVSMAAFRLAKL